MKPFLMMIYNYVGFLKNKVTQLERAFQDEIERPRRVTNISFCKKGIDTGNGELQKTLYFNVVLELSATEY